MKKIYILWPSIASYCIVTWSIIFVPVNAIINHNIYYGFPFAFLCISDEFTLTVKDTLLDYILLDPLTLMIDVVILVILINILILPIKLIIMKRRKEINNVTNTIK